MHDLYAILGLSRRATSHEIRTAYWALAKRYHPDINAADKQGEWRIKEINRAYAILGDAEARSAYDRDLAHRRAKARRGFWRSAATGATTFFVTASAVWVMVVVWKQTASIHQSQKNEPAVLVRNDSPAKKAPSELVANSGDHDRRNAPSKSVIASVPGLFGEPSSSVARERQGAPRGDRMTQPAAQSSSIVDPPPAEKIASAPLSQPAQPEAVVVTTAPIHAPPRAELANTTPLKAGSMRPIPARTVNPNPDHKSTPHDAGRKTADAKRIPKKSSWQFNVTERVGNTQTNSQGMEREPRGVSRTATSLQWPSADEPFVNVGGRHR